MKEGGDFEVLSNDLPRDMLEGNSDNDVFPGDSPKEISEETPAKIDAQFSNSVFVLDISETDADWVDFAYLSSIPTSTMVNQGSPAILSMDDTDDGKNRPSSRSL